jgi:hypothetical protein
MFIFKNLLFSILILCFCKILYTQELDIPNSRFNFTVSGGISLQLIDGTNGLLSYIEHNVIMQRLELKITYNIDRSAFSLHLGQDDFILKKSFTMDPNEPIYYKDNLQWLGLSFGYKILKKSNYELLGKYVLSGNASTQIVSLISELIKPINEFLTISLSLRYSSVFKKSFEKNVGNQIGFDYGVSYNF